MTAKQLKEITEEVKKQEEAKSKEQIQQDVEMEIVQQWESAIFSYELTNDERLRILCEHYGLKIAHVRTGRHQERTLGKASNRPNGQYSNIVANCEERFKYEIMGKPWRGAKRWKGKGKSRKCMGSEFDLQKAMNSIWKSIPKEDKRNMWNHKFSNEWWKVGDDPCSVKAPTKRTNSKAFMRWWDAHITGEEGTWEFIGKYDITKDFYKYYTEQEHVVASKETPVLTETIKMTNFTKKITILID